MNASKLGKVESPVMVAPPAFSAASEFERVGEGACPESGAWMLAKLLLTGVAGGEMGRLGAGPHEMTSMALAARCSVVWERRISQHDVE
jgi:hypothetical protein